MTAALNIDDPQHLVYLVATHLRMEPEERQHLLELDSVQEKLTEINGVNFGGLNIRVGP